MTGLRGVLAAVGRIVWTLLHVLFRLGPPKPPQPPTRLSQAEVLALAAAAMQELQIGRGLAHSYGLVPSLPRLADGRVVWTVSTATIGSGWSVSVDDATGEVGPVKRWGLR